MTKTSNKSTWWLATKLEAVILTMFLYLMLKLILFVSGMKASSFMSLQSKDSFFQRKIFLSLVKMASMLSI